MKLQPGDIPQADPIAFFLTWTTYGTWLPGDKRGWVTKPGRRMLPDSGREFESKCMMTEDALYLDHDQRRIVEATITDHCAIRGWYLHAKNCRTNHVHVVVTAIGRAPDVVMDQLKAWCTRRLKEHQLTIALPRGELRAKWWTQGGSQRVLGNEKALSDAVAYVVNGQDEPKSLAEANCFSPGSLTRKRRGKIIHP